MTKMEFEASPEMPGIFPCICTSSIQPLHSNSKLGTTYTPGSRSAGFPTRRRFSGRVKGKDSELSHTPLSSSLSAENRESRLLCAVLQHSDGMEPAKLTFWRQFSESISSTQSQQFVRKFSSGMKGEVSQTSLQHCRQSVQNIWSNVATCMRYTYYL